MLLLCNSHSNLLQVRLGQDICLCVPPGLIIVHFENASKQYVPTNYQRADVSTKCLSAYLHEAARKELCLQVCDGLYSLVRGLRSF